MTLSPQALRAIAAFPPNAAPFASREDFLRGRSEWEASCPELKAPYARFDSCSGYALHGSGPDALLFLHVGGFTAGSSRTHAGLCDREAGVTGLTVRSLAVRPHYPPHGAPLRSRNQAQGQDAD